MEFDSPPSDFAALTSDFELNPLPSLTDSLLSFLLFGPLSVVDSFAVVCRLGTQTYFSCKTL